MTSKIKTLLVAVLLILPVGAMAEDINLTKAKDVAEKFFIKSGVATRGGSHLTLVNKDEIVQTKSASNANFYIFNREEGGFVIVSGTEACSPILAYSLKNSFSMAQDMPDNLEFWLDTYRTYVGDLKAKGVKATVDQKAEWNDASTVLRVASPKVVELNTPTFAQSEPFNRLCPLDGNGETVAVGCVTIAAAQIMAYYKYPAHGTGTLPGYTCGGGKIVIPDTPLDDHVYDWDNILHSYDAGYTETQAKAVALLVRDVAYMGQVELHHSSTTGNTNFTYPNLAIYMGYDKSITRYLLRYTDFDFNAKVMRESIDRGEPVGFSATSTSGGGHAFVIDGYDTENDKFAINWGWNGSSNGFYRVNAFGSYTVDQLAYINMVPDRGNKPTSILRLQTSTVNGVTYNGFAPITATLKKGGTVTTKFGTIYNYSFSDLMEKFKGELTFVQKDKTGKIKGYLIDTPLPLPEMAVKDTYSFPNNIVLTIPEDIAAGDYVEAVYRPTGGTEWQSFYNYDNITDEIMGTLPLTLREATSITWFKTTRTFQLKTFKGSEYIVTDANGTTKRGGKITAESVTISTKTYPSGTYTLTVNNGDQSIKFKLII